MNQTSASRPPDDPWIPDRTDESDTPVNLRTGRLRAAFGYAFAGIWYLFRTQRNAQIHFLIGVCVVLLGWLLGLERWEWLVLVLTIGMVLFAEGVNTAIEATVDVATSRRHPLARIAKDVGAGSVLLCAIVSVIIGCILFLPHLWPVLQWVWSKIIGA